MRRPNVIAVLVQGVLTVAFIAALLSGRVPLGVPGEWEWPRITFRPGTWQLAIALVTVAGYSSLAALGFRSLGRLSTARRELAWVAALVVASVPTQALLQEGAPTGYGLAKWIFALESSGSSGYHTIARSRMSEPARFLADYPTWIAEQDALHIGTHPPGLFLVARASLTLMERYPILAKCVVAMAPGTASNAIQIMRATPSFTRIDAASLTLTGALTLLACASVASPLYYLARASQSAPTAWVAAALWPIVPSAILFQPTADAAFPLLSTFALALAAWAFRVGNGSWMFAAGSGLILAVGMTFTLAFLAIGLVVALILLTSPGPTWPHRVKSITFVGFGFLAATLAWWAATGANPFVIWWINQKNHARFYAEYHRTYSAWVIANPIELSIGLGIPAMTWAVIGFASPRKCPEVAWATLAVLAVLTLTGRSLSEVGRLWLPLMPTLLVGAASGFERMRGNGKDLAAAIGLTGLLVLVLEATIQVVYPF